MITPDQVRRVALSFGDTVDESKDDRLAFSRPGKPGFAWTYLERVHPRKPRVPRLDVLAVRCPVVRKELLIEAVSDVYFDDDHYRGYPAILVRLDAIAEDDLTALLKDAWRL
jgi:hypothetical protein